MIIEIAGVDGSGKTTLIHSLRRKINEEENRWAYERSFKSNQLRTLEQIAQREGKSRPHDAFPQEMVEFCRALEFTMIAALPPATLSDLVYQHIVDARAS
jgi:thymidylate kinase